MKENENKGIVNIEEINQKSDMMLENELKRIEKSKQINDMKSEYQDIEIPAILKNRVEKAIMNGKKKDNRSNMVQFTKFTGMAAAAAMLTIVVLANSNQNIAYAMEKIPVIGAITKVVTFRTYTDKTNNYEANIAVPKIETEDENLVMKEATEEVNKSVEDYTNMLIDQYNAEMEASDGEGHYGVDTSYKVITDNDKIFTLRIDTVIAMGGSANYSKFYHINKETGAVFTLKDIFKEKADYIKVISDNIKKQMEENMATDDSIIYFYGDEDIADENFKSIAEDQDFYFNDKSEIVISFDEYEVAPGYMGIVEFTIPTEVTASIMK